MEMDELNFDEVATDTAIPADEQLSRLAKYAKDQLKAEDSIQYLEQQLSEAKERHRSLSEGLIPELMSILGISEFKLDSGLKVTVKPFFTGKITDENQDAAYKWLEDNGHAAIVKHDLTVQCRLNEDKILERIRQLAKELNLDVKDKMGIHHSTMSAFLKEQITSGSYVPRDLLGVYSGFKTRIGR
jgi:hypothetical protein